MSKADDLTKQEYCRVLSMDSWKYDKEPSYFYRLWEDYQSNKKRTYYWDKYEYQGQVDAAKLTCKWIHHFYARISGLNVQQLEIKFK